MCICASVGACCQLLARPGICGVSFMYAQASARADTGFRIRMVLERDVGVGLSVAGSLSEAVAPWICHEACHVLHGTAAEGQHENHLQCGHTCRLE